MFLEIVCVTMTSLIAFFAYFNLKKKNDKQKSIEDNYMHILSLLSSTLEHGNDLRDLLSDSYNKALLTDGTGNKIVADIQKEHNTIIQKIESDRTSLLQEIDKRNKDLLKEIDAKLYATQSRIPAKPAKKVYLGLTKEDLETWNDTLSNINQKYPSTVNAATKSRKQALNSFNSYVVSLQKIAVEAEKLVENNSEECFENLTRLVNEFDIPKDKK